MMLDAQPALTQESVLVCLWGGVVTIEVPGQFQTIVE